MSYTEGLWLLTRMRIELSCSSIDCMMLRREMLWLWEKLRILERK
jgi:hypothetical protein